MRRAATLGLWVLVAPALFVAPGCGNSSTGTEAKPAAINGASAQGGTPAATGAPAEAAARPGPDPMHPTVVIETSLGNIPVVLDRQKAPLTVENFLQYVADGQYTQTLFHQVYKDYAILGGLLSADMKEKPAKRTVRNEAHNGLSNRRGTIAMVRQPESIDSATCQFFINVRDNPKLDFRGWNPDDPNCRPEDYGYCVFGTVTPEGLAVVDRIANVPVRDMGDFECVPVEPVVIRAIREVR